MRIVAVLPLAVALACDPATPQAPTAASPPVIAPPSAPAASATRPTASAPTSGTASPRGAMATFAQGSYALSGAEYWPYVGKEEPRYPEDVMWGFYPQKGVKPAGEEKPNPDTANPLAVACAEKSFAALREFLASDPPDLLAVVRRGKDAGYTERFYLWTNDYTRAADPFPPGVRPARLWYWKRKTAERNKPAGYWKWEATLQRDGRCDVPAVAEAHQYLAERLAILAQ